MPIKRAHVVATFGKQSPRNLITILFAFVLLFSACAPPATTAPSHISATPVVSSSVKINTFTPTPNRRSNDDPVPTALREQLVSLKLPANTKIQVKRTSKANQSATPVPWVYVLVAPFPTVTDGVTFA